MLHLLYHKKGLNSINILTCYTDKCVNWRQSMLQGSEMYHCGSIFGMSSSKIAFTVPEHSSNQKKSFLLFAPLNGIPNGLILLSRFVMDVCQDFISRAWHPKHQHN